VSANKKYETWNFEAVARKFWRSWGDEGKNLDTWLRTVPYDQIPISVESYIG
jgi:hypothetical protein